MVLHLRIERKICEEYGFASTVEVRIQSIPIMYAGKVPGYYSAGFSEITIFLGTAQEHLAWTLPCEFHNVSC